MKAVELKADEAWPGSEPGWYVVNENGAVVSGWFPTREEAEEWIERQQPVSRIDDVPRP